MSKVPYNGYLQVWLQRVTKPKAVGLDFLSDEPICKIVNAEPATLWENAWIANAKLKQALDVSKILISEATETPEVMIPEEVELFTKNAWAY